jgi:DNA-binding GntR family transcriptional regulator
MDRTGSPILTIVYDNGYLSTSLSLMHPPGALLNAVAQTSEPDVTLALRIYNLLAKQILTGEIVPGHRLDEQSIATQFGVSRTPVREALRELAARHLIQLIPRRGGIVTKFGTDELIDMLEAECEIEGLCARLSAHRMSALEKVQLREVHERASAASTGGELGRYFEINKQFHDLICAGTHNATLEKMARDLRFRLSPFRRSDAEADAKTIMSRSTAEHSSIVDAIVRDQAEAAYEAMRAHDARVNAGVVKLLKSKEEARSEVPTPA